MSQDGGHVTADLARLPPVLKVCFRGNVTVEVGVEKSCFLELLVTMNQTNAGGGG